jgi:hypothetical protein
MATKQHNVVYIGEIERNKKPKNTGECIIVVEILSGILMLTHMISLTLSDPKISVHRFFFIFYFFWGGSIHFQCTENVDVCVFLFDEIHIKICLHCSMIVVHFIPFKDSQIQFFVYNHIIWNNHFGCSD